MSSSMEYKVLRKYYDKLQTLVQGGLLTVSSRAFAVHLLTSGEHSTCTHMMYPDDHKANCFMQAVNRKVENNPQAFYTFMDVLKQEASNGFMVEIIEKDLKQMKENQTDDCPPSGAADDKDDGIDLSLVDDTLLSIDDDIADVQDAVEDLAAKYYSLGQALRVRHSELEIIKKNHKDDARDALGQVIAAWLNTNYNVDKFGPPTWRMLVDAVARPSGGNNCAVARKIARDHPVITAQAQ